MTEQENLTQEGKRRLDSVLSAFKDLGKRLDFVVKQQERTQKLVEHLIRLLEGEALPDVGELIDELQAIRRDAGNPLNSIGDILRELRR